MVGMKSGGKKSVATLFCFSDLHFTTETEFFYPRKMVIYSTKLSHVLVGWTVIVHHWLLTGGVAEAVPGLKAKKKKKRTG